MAVGLTITRNEHTASDLRRLAGNSHDGAQVRRLLALALVLEGRSRGEAAIQNGMERQTLGDWVHRYNAEGVAGLQDRSSPGRTPMLSAEQREELKALVINGPDLATHKVVRWRCKDLRVEVAKRFGVEVHESTIGKWLHQLGLTRLQPRPVHPKKDPESPLKKIPQPLERSSAWLRINRANRDLVSRRSAGWPEGRPYLYLGRQQTAHASRQPP